MSRHFSEGQVGLLTEIASSKEFLWNSAVWTESGRLFSSMPGWLGPTPGVVEVFPDGSFAPFPGNHWNQWQEGKDPTRHFVDVNSIFPDGKGSLWIVDAAAPHFGVALEGAVKLIQIDIATGQTVRVLKFAINDAHQGTRLAHVRFHGDHAFLVESKEGSLFIIDLRDDSYRRVLVGHPYMRCLYDDVPVIEGRRLQLPDGNPVHIHSDLLEFGKDPDQMFMMCLFGSKVFKTHVSVFKDPAFTDADIAARMVVAYEIGPFTAGICRDRDGEIYLTDAENNGVVHLAEDGTLTPIVCDPSIVWPISPSVGPDGCIYFTSTQLNRVPLFSGGRDLVEKPWRMFKAKVTSGTRVVSPEPKAIDKLNQGSC